MLAGYKEGQPFLGTVGMIGTHYKDTHIATGQSCSHLFLYTSQVALTSCPLLSCSPLVEQLMQQADTSLHCGRRCMHVRLTAAFQGKAHM